MTRLNERQQEAVEYTQGPMLVLAGAGSGKTSVITSKIAWLIRKQNTPARRIVAVTFTNKAAREMKDRVRKLVEREEARGLIVSTFHTLGLRILKQEMRHISLRRGFSILDQYDSRDLLKELLQRGDSEEDVEHAEFIQQRISQWKNDLISPEQAMTLIENEDDQRAAIAYEHYNRMLRACNAVDFDDLIYLPVYLFRQQPEVLERWRNRIRHLLVDEYQDTNSAQYELVRMLVEPLGRFTVVGDDDQSIYAWRGARPENLIQLTRDWPNLKIVKLEQNYRSTGRILKAANAVIANNPHVLEKELWSDHIFGDPIQVCSLPNEDQEAEWICADIFHRKLQMGKQYRDFAVLYRGNHQSRLLEMKLQAMQIPYKVSGGKSFFSRTEIKDVMSYLRLLVNPDDDNAFLRIINTPRREIGSATLEKLAGYAQQRDSTLYNVCDDLELRAITNPQTASRLTQFKQWLDQKREFCFSENSLQAVRELILDIDYESWIHQHASSPRIAEKRMENVWHLVASIQRMLEKDEDADLEAVIGKLILLDILEQQEEEDDSDRVQLLTLHAAKGLEYPCVYMMGVEEELLPHRSSIEEDTIEEERRLMYVGITRARATLTLTMASSRKNFGEKNDTTPSRFIDELPQEDLQWLGEKREVSTEEEDAIADAAIANLRAMLE